MELGCKLKQGPYFIWLTSVTRTWEYWFILNCLRFEEWLPVTCSIVSKKYILLSPFSIKFHNFFILCTILIFHHPHNFFVIHSVFETLLCTNDALFCDIITNCEAYLEELQILSPPKELKSLSLKIKIYVMSFLKWMCSYIV